MTGRRWRRPPPDDTGTSRSGVAGHWRRRSLRTRITVVVGLVALVALLAVGRLGTGLLYSAVVASGDAAARDQASATAAAVRAGTVGAATGAATGGGPAGGIPPTVRVTDTAGAPADGRPPLPLGADVVGRLAAGEAVTVAAAGGPDGGLDGGRLDGGGPRRWVGVPAVTPDGTTRLVLASRDLVGASALTAEALPWLVLAALLAAVVVTAATWAATRAALRPVDRMRAAAAELGPGERLPVPPARDELSALAGEFNALLARRDDAVLRLERFTDDAAHEMRSPLAALRAQAEVAVVHPEAEPAVDTWRSVADEAARLSVLLADLLALARADAGERASARPVDLVTAVREAVARADAAGGPAHTVWTPVPARVAATPAEVALVLDNLVANASRHARSVVHVSVVPAGRWVRLIVDDDGPGIPADERDRVFDRFTRLDPSAGAGAGLGLALVGRLVAGRGGTARAGTSPEGGARFTVRWPAA